MTIERLNQSEPTLQSSVPFHDPQDGADRRATLYQIAELLKDSRTPMVTVYASPGVTGFNATIDPDMHGTSVHLMLMPTAAVTSMTLTLPATPGHGQEVLVTTTVAIDTFTVVAVGGATVTTITSIAAGGFFTLRFDGVHGLWVRVA